MVGTDGSGQCPALSVRTELGWVAPVYGWVQHRGTTGKSSGCGQSPGDLHVELGMAWSPLEACLHLINMDLHAPQSALTPLVPLALVRLGLQTCKTYASHSGTAHLAPLLEAAPHLPRPACLPALCPHTVPLRGDWPWADGHTAGRGQASNGTQRD